jgi:heme-degrading monooxygenase HmoA
MYGTIARLRITPGSEAMLQVSLEAFQDKDPSSGFVSWTFYRSDDDPLEVWLSVVFESRDAYRANAESESQHARFIRLRSILEDDPEWHDGEVLHRSVRAAGA